MVRQFLTSSALAVSLLAPLATQALGIDVVIDGKVVNFMDVSNSAWFSVYVKQAAEAGIVTGYKDEYGKPTGKFMPQNEITVAEALKIASEGAGYDEEAYATALQSGSDHWASAYLAVARGEEFPVASRSTVERRATRAEVAAMIAAAFRVNVQTTVLNRYTDVDVRTEYGTSIEALSRDGIVEGDTTSTGEAAGTFRPTERINRAEVTKMVMAARAEYGMPGKGRTPAAQ